jgi:hypothetical protein
MEFNYDDPVKNYQARYFKNLGYSDQDILGILGDLPSADTGGGVTPQLVQQLGYSNDGGGDRSDFIGKIPENYYTPEGAGTIPNNNIIDPSITSDLVDEFTPNRFDVPGGISSFGLANNPEEEDYVEQSMWDKFGNTFQAFRNSPFSTVASAFAGGIPGVLANIASKATQGGTNYQQFTPGMTYNQDASMINDAYDPETGTNRFDRATPGSFASFRTLADYFNRDTGNDGGGNGNGGGSGDSNSPEGGGSYCFDPSTPIQMADGSTKQIKNIQLGDDTKGGEVTGVFQFKASDEIHDYKGVTVAGSHFVKEDGRFIMVKDSPLSVKIDKIPVVYSLDTSGRRIFIKDIEFADYNGDGVAKNFLNNAGVDLSGFDKEVLRQVEQRLL